MITGNQTWTNALTSPSKQPLYTFEIPDWAIIIASFTTNLLKSSNFGYGIVLLGIGGYGT